jgi:hypothetical protein
VDPLIPDITAGGLYSLATIVGDQIFVASITPKVGNRLIRTGDPK